MERSTAGSEETARRVMEMCGADGIKNALFFGDDVFTPRLIADETGAKVLAAFYEEYRAEKAKGQGLDAKTVGAYEIPQTDGGILSGTTDLPNPTGFPAGLKFCARVLQTAGRRFSERFAGLSNRRLTRKVMLNAGSGDPYRWTKYCELQRNRSSR